MQRPPAPASGPASFVASTPKALAAASASDSLDGRQQGIAFRHSSTGAAGTRKREPTQRIRTAGTAPPSNCATF